MDNSGRVRDPLADAKDGAVNTLVLLIVSLQHTNKMFLDPNIAGSQLKAIVSNAEDYIEAQARYTNLLRDAQEGKAV